MQTMEGLARQMRGLEEKLRSVMRGCLADTAENAAVAARAAAPVDSGELRGGIQRQNAGALAETVVSAAPHAAMVEFGTSRMGAQPYLMPAAQEVQEMFFSSAREAAAQAMREVFG